MTTCFFFLKILLSLTLLKVFFFILNLNFMKNVNLKTDQLFGRQKSWIGKITLVFVTLFLSVNFLSAQTVPELMYFKFNGFGTVPGEIPNDANPATRLGAATATV